jgi:3-deoxy-D-manno-octulosonic-acid transferase
LKALFWFFYWPLFKIIGLFVFWIPELQERKLFERKNLKESLAASFAETLEQADLCFEFSSEGEYQQVAPLIEDALGMGKKIELVFFSPSVEKTIVELAQKFPQNIRYLRFPLMTLSPFHLRCSFLRWVTSKELVLVRYDLFPDFLVWSRLQNHVLKIIWVSFKKERKKNRRPSWFKLFFLSSAHKLVFASDADQKLALSLGLKGESYDYRIEQIRRRLEQKSFKFQKQFQSYPILLDLLSQYPRERTLILGNAWPSDLALLHNLPEDVFLLVVPHKLSADILQAFERGLIQLGRSPVVVEQIPEEGGDCLILNKKGVLCELYADFGKAYVGGGLEESVHSLLEPLVSGADAIAAGPKNHRSTEFDVAESFGLVKEVKTAEEFGKWLELGPVARDNKRNMNEIFARYPELRRMIFPC